MNSSEAKRIFYDQYENILMSGEDRFTLTKFIEPYKGILHRKTDKLLFVFDSEKKYWKKRTR
jgi:hypothetical protein